VEPFCGSTSCIALIAALNYWTSFRTACWAWLDCCRAAIPVDWRTLYWVMLATVLPMSAFWRPLAALCRLVTWLAMLLLAAVRRLTEAPMTPRCAEIVLIAAVTSPRAVIEEAELVRTSAFRLRAVADRALMVVVISVLVAPVVVPSPRYTVLVSLEVAATIGPRTASLLETVTPFEAASAIVNFPPTIVAVVPAESVPAVTALVMAVWRSEILSPAAAVNTKVPPVAESVILVTEFAVNAVVVRSGLPTDPCVEEKVVGALDEKTLEPLKFVAWPIWLISERIDWNSVSSAVDWLDVMPVVEPSVARVTARLRSVVTCDRAPSAVYSRPMPLLAFCWDWVRAAMFALSPLTIDNPAASSEPELIFMPVESWVRVFCRFA